MMRRDRVLLLWRLLAILSVILIWAGSLLPAEDIARVGSALEDKLLHFLGYLLVALLIAQGWRQLSWWTVWLLTFLIGAGAEVAQELLTRSRTFEWFDFVANGGGAIAGVAVSQLIRITFAERPAREDPPS